LVFISFSISIWPCLLPSILFQAYHSWFYLPFTHSKIHPTIWCYKTQVAEHIKK
jgi:hypothetical protein